MDRKRQHIPENERKMGLTTWMAPEKRCTASFLYSSSPTGFQSAPTLRGAGWVGHFAISE